MVSLQVCAAWAVRDLSVWQLLVAGYFVGAFANHNLFLAVHELTHNLGFKRPIYNKLMAVVANLPIGVPMATKFQKYHREHHTSQGVEGIDMDIATKAEADFIHNNFQKLVRAIPGMLIQHSTCCPLHATYQQSPSPCSPVTGLDHLPALLLRAPPHVRAPLPSGDLGRCQRHGVHRL